MERFKGKILGAKKLRKTVGQDSEEPRETII